MQAVGVRSNGKRPVNFGMRRGKGQKGGVPLGEVTRRLASRRYALPAVGCPCGSQGREEGRHALSLRRPWVWTSATDMFLSSVMCSHVVRWAIAQSLTT